MYAVLFNTLLSTEQSKEKRFIIVHDIFPIRMRMFRTTSKKQIQKHVRACE